MVPCIVETAEVSKNEVLRHKTNDDPRNHHVDAGRRSGNETQISGECYVSPNGDSSRLAAVTTANTPLLQHSDHFDQETVSLFEPCVSAYLALAGGSGSTTGGSPIAVRS